MTVINATVIYRNILNKRYTTMSADPSFRSSIYHKRLVENLGLLSVGQTWEELKAEWRYAYSSLDHSGSSKCLCGKEKIHELCFIRSRLTNHLTFVGNVCINKFLGIDAPLFAKRLIRATTKPEKKLPMEMILAARREHIIRSSEVGKYKEDKNVRRIANKKIVASTKGIENENIWEADASGVYRPVGAIRDVKIVASPTGYLYLGKKTHALVRDLEKSLRFGKELYKRGE